MEINEIRYFLAVARTENMHRASEEIGISAGSLSKAIAKLEDELNVKLFTRVGRNIRLSEHGKFLKSKGHELLNFEEAIKTQILGEDSTFNVVIGGSEVLLSSFGVELAKQVKGHYPSTSFQFEVVEKSDLISKVRDGEIDLGLTTYDLPKTLDQKILADIKFSTFISSLHPLFRSAKKGSLAIEKVLEHGFVVPQKNLLGRMKSGDSKDGWRDDKWPRKVTFFSDSLKTIESLVLQGRAIAYLPNYYGKQANMHKLDIVGCPFHCTQKVRLFTKDKERAGWLKGLFHLGQKVF